MSATTTHIELAPVSLRLRLAVSALLVSWALAALFIILGWKVSRTDARAESRNVTHISAATPAAAPLTIVA
jgi:TRAP-type C4-dicarboxylate transport system permease small subunit